MLAVKHAGLKAGKPAAFAAATVWIGPTMQLATLMRATASAAQQLAPLVVSSASVAQQLPPLVGATSLCIATTTAPAVGLHTSSHRCVRLPLPLVVAPAHASGCNTKWRQNFRSALASLQEAALPGRSFSGRQTRFDKDVEQTFDADMPCVRLAFGSARLRPSQRPEHGRDTGATEPRADRPSSVALRWAVGHPTRP